MFNCHGTIAYMFVLQDTWPHLRAHVETICLDSFMAMFEDNPDVKDKFFQFRDYTIEDLKKPEHQLGKTIWSLFLFP